MRLKTIEAVIEIQPIEENPPWAVTFGETDYSFIRLFSGTTDEEIGSVMLAACSYNRIEIYPSSGETLKAFLAEEFVLPGGLQFSGEKVSGTDSERVKIVPGCCCGLEDWRDWLDVPNGSTIWAGHDPNPGVEFLSGDIIRVWQDEKAANVAFVDFGAKEMRDLLAKIASDLKGFVERLDQWTAEQAPELAALVAAHFAAQMSI